MDESFKSVHAQRKYRYWSLARGMLVISLFKDRSHNCLFPLTRDRSCQQRDIKNSRRGTENSLAATLSDLAMIPSVQ